VTGRARTLAALAAVAAVVLAVVLAVAATGNGSGGDGGRPTAGDPGADGGGPSAAGTAADDFLAGYVEPDGRVVRHDQGGDTVSEGQAYALLVAAAVGDEGRFDAVWSWTRDHLQRDDGLFAWRWQDGEIADAAPAADADIDLASALVAGAARFDEPALTDDARRIADAVLDHETATVDGDAVLVAGPWAADERIVNPSYAARCDHADLARLTGDDRWRDVGDQGLEQVGAFVADGDLPPDWAALDGDGAALPIAGPDRQDGPGRYGLDAARIPARLSACPAGREVAARMWEQLQGLDGDGAAVAYSLDGRPVDEGRHPLGLVGAAAAARAAGEDGEAARLFAEAAQLEDRQPSYYGAAWLAIGEAVLGLAPEAGDDAAAIGPRSRTVAGAGAGAGAATVTVRLAAAGRSVPVQEPSTTQPTPTTTAPTTTSEPPPTTAPPTTAPTTTDPPTSTPPGTAPDGTPDTTTPTGATGSADDGTGTGDDGGTGTGDDAGQGGTPAGGPDGAAPAGETGDLSSGGPAPGAGTTDAGSASPGEPARRRTGAIGLAGLAGTVGLAAALGLRERARTLRSLRAARPPAA
jgi:endoglucanase